MNLLLLHGSLMWFFLSPSLMVTPCPKPPSSIRPSQSRQSFKSPSSIHPSFLPSPKSHSSKTQNPNYSPKVRNNPERNISTNKTRDPIYKTRFLLGWDATECMRGSYKQMRRLLSILWGTLLPIVGWVVSFFLPSVIWIMGECARGRYGLWNEKTWLLRFWDGRRWRRWI